MVAPPTGAFSLHRSILKPPSGNPCAYDNEGRRTARTYPSAHTSGFNPYTGKTYTYGYGAARLVARSHDQKYGLQRP
jgi:hypothetical protein